MDPKTSRSERSSEAGFTLIEAVVAILVLVVGLAAVSNLLIVAATNNTTAGKATATTNAATQALEELKRRPFVQLVPGGSLTSDLTGFNIVTTNRGVGTITTRWVIAPLAADPAVLAITVQARDESPVTGLNRSQSVFTTLRAQ